MKTAYRILVIITIAIAVGGAGYGWGRRDGFAAEQRNMLQVSSMIAALMRENRPDVVLQFAEKEMDYSALDLQRSEGVVSPVAVLKDISKRRYYDQSFQRASDYISHYPHSDISVSAVSYIQAQPESGHTEVR